MMMMMICKMIVIQCYSYTSCMFCMEGLASVWKSQLLVSLIDTLHQLKH